MVDDFAEEKAVIINADIASAPDALIIAGTRATKHGVKRIIKQAAIANVPLHWINLTDPPPPEVEWKK